MNKQFWKDIALIFLAATLFAVLFVSLARVSNASPPDPWIRMQSPSGCSGTVVHSSRRYGVFVVTCKHCSRRGDTVSVRFVKDGKLSDSVTGRCIAEHPRYDCSLVRFDPQRFYELPQRKLLGRYPNGPRVGQNVISVGSFAGGTWSPALRSVQVASSDGRGYRFSLTDGAWGGHSGGGVCTVRNGRPDRFLGPLWGVQSGRTGLVTGPRAVWELIYGQPRNQAFFSVQDHPQKTDLNPNTSRENDVWVYGDNGRIEREVENSHILDDHFDFHFRRSETGRVTIRWQDETGKQWFYHGWPGVRGLLWQYEHTTGRKVQCPGGNCPPYNGSQFPRQPQQPGWGSNQPGGNYVFPPPPAGPDDPQRPTSQPFGNSEKFQELEDELEKLREEKEQLEEQKEKDRREAELEAMREEFQERMDEALKRIERRNRPVSPPYDGPAQKAYEDRNFISERNAPQRPVNDLKEMERGTTGEYEETASGVLPYMTQRYVSAEKDLKTVTEQTEAEVQQAKDKLGEKQTAESNQKWIIFAIVVVVLVAVVAAAIVVIVLRK